MPDKDDTRDILDRTKAIIVDALGLASVRHLDQKTACRNITPPPEEKLWGERLIRNIYEQISQSGATPTNSRENWRLVRQTSISKKNKGKEVLLEKAIAVLCEGGVLDGWFNQVPVASGLITNRNRRTAIDLVKILDSNAFEFIELKWNANNPVYAAFEILGYGLIYLYSRCNAEAFHYDKDKIKLFTADAVSLHVLAPYPFYSRFELTWLEHGLAHGIAVLADDLTDDALSMDLQFYTFAEDFKLPFSTGAEVSALRSVSADHPQVSAIVAALEDVRPVRSENSASQ